MGARTLAARLGGWLVAVENGVLVALLGAMIALAGAQIGLRNLLDQSIAWGDPLLRVMVLWLGLIGAMVATRNHEHISIDIVSRYLGGRAAAFNRMLTDGFTALVCATIAWHAARFVLLDMEAGTRAFAGVPVWVCELIIPLGFGVMALRALLSALSPRPPDRAPTT